MGLTREDLENDLLRKQYEGVREHVPLVPEDAFHASLDAILAGWNPKQDLWVFAYGSLIWNPLFHYAERRPAKLHGYHRCFCVRSRMARGSVDKPGLVLGLDLGGCCNGVAFRIEAAKARHEMKIIWRREMVLGSYRPRWVNVKSGDRSARAVAFVVNHAHPHYAGSLSDEAIVDTLATACGKIGSCAEYLIQTVESLASHGVEDAHLGKLRRRVLAACAHPNT